MKTQILYVNASVGAGKTSAFISHINTSPHINAIYAAPTAKLALQTHTDIRRQGGKAKLVLSSQSMAILEEKGNEDTVSAEQGGMVDKVDEAIRDLCDDVSYGALVISHAALLMYLDSDLTSNKTMLKGCSLYVDEQLPVFDFLRFTPDEETFDTYLDFISCHHVVEDIYRLEDNPEYVDEYEDIIKMYHKRDNLNCKQFSRILSVMQKRTSAVFAKVTDTYLQTVSIVDPISIASKFKSTTVLCADFLNTLQYHLFKEVFDVEFVEDTALASLISKDTHSHGSLLKIYHLMDDNDKSSKGMLHDNKPKGLPVESKQNVRDLLFSQVAAHWPDGDFLYATHKSWTFNGNGNVKTLDDLDNVASISVKSHGQNQYTSYHRVAALTVCQFPTAVKGIMEKLSNIDGNVLNDAFKLESVYQTIGRTAIRSHDFMQVGREVEVIVLDKTTADMLAGIFTGAVVEGKTGVFKKKRKKWTSSGNPRKKSDKSTGMTKAEMNFMSAKKIAYRNGSSFQDRTKTKIADVINKYPNGNYKLSDFGL